jgi:hypothetical protein
VILNIVVHADLVPYAIAAHVEVQMPRESCCTIACANVGLILKKVGAVQETERVSGSEIPVDAVGEVRSVKRSLRLDI